ncbi:MAG TPA: hypothetical protein VFD84_01965 [Candidatus Binatia bacterium]|nr:hypothetical protein [Candidatus Binatia bacterium]
MSSILEALREIENAGPLARGAGAWRGDPRRPRRRWAPAALVLGAALAAAVLTRGRPSPAPPAPIDASADAAVLPPAAPAPPLAISRANEPPPRARVAASALAVAAVPPAPPRASRPHAADVEEPESSGEAPAPPPGEPHVRLRSLVYAADPDERVVTLSINHGSPVTLHEGEGAGGVEVGLIMRDAVYLRHRGNIFAVHLRR